MTASKTDAAAKKRSEASKKGAATRKTNEALAEERENAKASPDVETTEDSTEQAEDESYRPKHKPLQNAGLDQHQAEKDRQEQLAEQRDEHNERTGAHTH